MRRSTLWLFPVAFAVPAVLLLQATSHAQSPAIAIAAVEAKLFYSNSGRFSANIIGNAKIILHNTPMGEGTVEGPSENTLLVVRLQGPPKSGFEDLRLRIVATTASDTLADKEIEVGSMNSAGNFYAACWLDDTGCEPVDVLVQLVHGSERAQRRVSLPFECSE